MLTNSPRSIRGTARSTAYWKGIEPSRQPPLGCAEPGQQIVAVGRSGRRRVSGARGSGRVGIGQQPASGTSARIVLQRLGVDLRREFVVHPARVADPGQHVIVVAVRGRAKASGGPRRGGNAGRRRGRSPTGCGARSAGWCCGRCGRRWPRASSQTIRAASSAITTKTAVVADRSRQEVHGQVQPGAGRDQLLHLLVGLPATDLGVDLDQREVGHRDAERRPSSPTMISATSAFGPWPAPVNLTTYVPRSSASIRPGSDPPSRSGVR